MLMNGCETWSLTTRDRSRLLVLEDLLLRMILQTRLRSNCNTQNLIAQPLITSAIKSRRLRWWAGHMVQAPAEREIYKALYIQAATVQAQDEVDR